MLFDFISLLLPNYCLACQTLLVKNEQWLCTVCFVSLPQTNYHLETDNPVAQKFYGRVPTSYAMALYKFSVGTSVQRLIHQLKYGNNPGIGEMLGRMYGAQLRKKTWESNFDCIVPVPLHPRRLRQRGYNQSNYFAKGLADLLKIPWYSHCIQRTKNTTSQTQSSRIERLYNLIDTFGVIDAQPVQNKHVLLVDDVITTGATLEACAELLLTGGAKEISIATIGVAD